EPDPRASRGSCPPRERPPRPPRRPSLRRGSLRGGGLPGAGEPLRPVLPRGLRHSPARRRRRSPPLDEPGLLGGRRALQGGGAAGPALGCGPRSARLRPLPRAPDPWRDLTGARRQLRRRGQEPARTGTARRGRFRQGGPGLARAPLRNGRLSRRHRRRLQEGLPPARLPCLRGRARPRLRAPDRAGDGPGREGRL
ncbi:MAG: Segregation and condensation protein B, partial [uncultured Rubrobacteraceae bacterium]